MLRMIQPGGRTKGRHVQREAFPYNRHGAALVDRRCFQHFTGLPGENRRNSISAAPHA